MSDETSNDGSAEYSADSIKVLRGLEAVRKLSLIHI